MRLTHEVNLKVSVDSIQGTVLFSPLFGNGWGERAKGRERGDERGGNENECVVAKSRQWLIIARLFLILNRAVTLQESNY